MCYFNNNDGKCITKTYASFILIIRAKRLRNMKNVDFGEFHKHASYKRNEHIWVFSCNRWFLNEEFNMTDYENKVHAEANKREEKKTHVCENLSSLKYKIIPSSRFSLPCNRRYRKTFQNNNLLYPQFDIHYELLGF